MANGEDEDDWEQDYYSLSTVNLDCLMPNGIIIQMHVDADSTIARIKQVVVNISLCNDNSEYMQ